MEKTITFPDAKSLASHINDTYTDEAKAEQMWMKAIRDKSVTGIYALTTPMDNAELALTRELSHLKDIVKDILEFAMKYGQEAASEAIWHGAFNDSVWMGSIILEFVHPRDEVREFTPAWIIQAYINIVD